MKTLVKWAFRLLILFVVLVVAAVLLMDTVFKAVAEHRIKDQTGLDVKIGKFEISFLNRKVVMENFVLYNSAEFGGSPMINLPELYVEADPEALQSRKLHLKMVSFNLDEINYVESQNGKNNFMDLMTRLEERKKLEEEKKKGRKIDTDVEFDGIDTLNLTLGKFSYTNLKNPAKSQQFELDIKNEVLTGLKSEEDFEKKLVPLLSRNISTIISSLLPGKPVPPQPRNPPTVAK